MPPAFQVVYQRIACVGGVDVRRRYAKEELTGENIARIADEIELKIQGGLAGRPLLSVPHITSAGGWVGAACSTLHSFDPRLRTVANR